MIEALRGIPGPVRRIAADPQLLAAFNGEEAPGRTTMKTLIPPVPDQVAFWQKAALAALTGCADTAAPEDMADRAARLADALTKRWLDRLARWGAET
jgi:hypothetical protein